MATTSITAANAVLMLSVPGLYDSPQRIQGFSPDSAITTDANTTAEVVMGVDGFMSAGYTPSPIVMKFTLAADSPSLKLMRNWINAQNTIREVITADASLFVPSIGADYTYTKGVLMVGKSLPDVKKTLQPIEFQITWESEEGANV